MAPVRHEVFRIVKKFMGMEYSPLYFSWDLLFTRSDMLDAHRCALRAAWPQYPQVLRWALLLFSLVVWPLRAAIWSFLYTRTAGKEIALQTGKPVGRQMGEQMLLALRHTIPPFYYYTYAFYLDSNRAKATQYLLDFEMGHLLSFLNRYHDRVLLSDKRRFAAACVQHDLPTVPIIAAFADGSLSFLDSAYPDLPARDLFAKPSIGCRGGGTLCWEYIGGGLYRSHHGEVLSRGELMTCLEQLSRRACYLVQPRLVNHAAIADLTGSALSTARIITSCTDDGDTEFVLADFKVPVGREIKSNFTSGTLASPIDGQTGLLGPAVRGGIDQRRYGKHPETGARIEGRMLPDWHKAVELTLCAHRIILSPFAFVGWDVAFTDEGPLLLEVNHNWGVESLQKSHALPLGETRFAALCAQRIQQVLARPVTHTCDGRRLHFY